MHETTAMEILACNDRNDLKKLLAKRKQQSLNARMKPNPKHSIKDRVVHFARALPMSSISSFDHEIV